MKFAILLGVCAAQLPLPPPLSTVSPYRPKAEHIAVTVTTNVAIRPTLTASTNACGSLMVSWLVVDTNVWVPEISTNLLNWDTAGNHFVQIPTRETRTNRTQGNSFNSTCTVATGSNWFVRLRKL